jgi:hypothetical protein
MRSPQKRWLAGLVASIVMFSVVYAAAASLGLTVETLSADQEAVVSCDTDGVASDYTTVYSATANGGAGGYVVDVVTLSGIAGACNGFDFKVSLADSTGAQLGEVTTLAAALGGAGDARTLDSDFQGAQDVLASDVVLIAVSITDPS